MGPAVWTESAGRAARPRTLELYDLHTDPHELNDLLLSSPGPTAHALRDRLQALIPRFRGLGMKGPESAGKDFPGNDMEVSDAKVMATALHLSTAW